MKLLFILSFCFKINFCKYFLFFDRTIYGYGHILILANSELSKNNYIE